MAAAETREQRGDRLAPVAEEWVARLRGEAVDVLAAELLDPLPRRDLYALIGLLGGAVDPTVTPEIWWGWARHRDVIEHPSPIVWDAGEQPIEELDSQQINGLIERMSREGRKDWEIGDRVGLRPEAVQQRRLRLRRTDKARAGVA